MDLEERKRQLAEVRAAREAKQRQLEKLVASSAVSAPPQPVASPLPAASSQSVPAATDLPSTGSSWSHCSNVGATDIPPIPSPAVECYDREVETDHCYVYAESRPNPSDVVRKEDFLQLQQQLREAEFSDPIPAPTSSSQRQCGQVFAPFWDKTTAAATNKILRTAGFVDFVAKGAATIQQSLRQSETSASLPAEAKHTALGDAATSSNGPRITRRGCFVDPACNGRVVVSLCFQPKSSDAFAVGLSAPMSSTSPRGLVLLYYARRQGSAPQRFVTEHEVRCVTFSPFHEYLLIAGTTNGRIVCWNTNRGETPTVVSFPSPDAHSAAILRMYIQGDSNANQLVTVCRDGVVCTWPTDQPRRPTSSKECFFADKSERPSRVISAAAFVQNNHRSELSSSAKLFLGTLEGHVLETSSSNPRTISLKKIHKERGHDGTILAADCHPHTSDARVSELLLTTSADAACKLWLGSTNVALDAFTDCIHDVKWSPNCPSVFAAADAAGRLTVWNVATSIIAPVSSLLLHSTDARGTNATEAKHTPAAILRVEWDDSGEHLLCGTSSGEAFFLDVANLGAHDQSLRQLTEWVGSKFTSAEQ